MKKFVLILIGTLFAQAACHFKEVGKMDFESVRVGDLPVGWIVSCSCKAYPGIWEVNEKKELFIKYPRGHRKSEKNIFFTKDFYFKDGAISAKVWSDKDGGIIFRARDRKNYYAVFLDFKKGELFVEEIAHNKPKKILEKSIGKMDRPQILEVRFCDKKAKIYLNGKKIATIDNLIQRRGGVGVVASADSKATFDDIVIKIAQ